MIGALLLILCAGASARAADGDEVIEKARQFFARQQWEPAKVLLRQGWTAHPRDKRFPLELAGVAFKQNRLQEAKADLRQALALDPGDAYANEFLGTIYLLEENLEASLRYWNQIGRPYIDEVKLEPQPGLDPILANRIQAFTPGGVLKREELLTTRARLDFLGVFPSYRIDLAPKPDEHFDATVRLVERGGWPGIVSLLSGLPYLTVYPRFFNLHDRGMNLVSLVRWDDQKRRVFADFSSPLGTSANWRYRLFLDGRNENWDVPAMAPFNMKTIEAGAELQTRVGGRWGWTSGFVISHRQFSPASIFPSGTVLKYRATVDRWLFRIPERNFTMRAMGSLDYAPTFTRVQGSLKARWHAMTAQFRSGKTLGTPPFDQLFQLGQERDNDLWMRAHIGTADGKKGNAPLGRDYLLFNWEIDKTIYNGSLVKLKVGPFLDSGRIYDPGRDFGSRKWLTDAGVQCKIVAFGGVGIAISYGKDLRTGHNAFYVFPVQ